MAFEDFTTYTEVDASSVISVTATGATIVGMHPRTIADLRDDKGEGNIGDFTHRFRLDWISGTDNSVGNVGRGSAWTITTASIDNVTEMATENDGMFLRLFFQGGNGYIILRDEDTGNQDGFFPLTLPLTFWIGMERSGNTLIASIYNDYAFTTLADKLTITCATDPKRYIHAAVGSGQPGDTDTDIIDFNISYLQLATPFLDYPVVVAPTTTIPITNFNPSEKATIHMSGRMAVGMGEES